MKLERKRLWFALVEIDLAPLSRLSCASSEHELDDCPTESVQRE